MATKQWHDAKTAIAAHALPILKDYMIFGSGYPAAMHDYEGVSVANCEKRWHDILIKIINSLQVVIDDSGDIADEDFTEYQEGLVLFGKWFHHLWD
jgi:hypothetical protein